MYITSNPGKEIRGAMIEAFDLWLNVPEDKLQIIRKVVNMLHSASLM
jgi:geranylgeranyl diphosphate synthase type 3